MHTEKLLFCSKFRNLEGSCLSSYPKKKTFLNRILNPGPVPRIYRERLIRNHFQLKLVIISHEKRCPLAGSYKSLRTFCERRVVYLIYPDGLQPPNRQLGLPSGPLHDHLSSFIIIYVQEKVIQTLFMRKITTGDCIKPM